MEVSCPNCKTEFEIEMWSDGDCPTCGLDYWFEDFWNEETNEDWFEVHWGEI